MFSSLKARFAAGSVLFVIIFAAVWGVLNYDPASHHDLARLNVDEAMGAKQVNPNGESAEFDSVAPAPTKPASQKGELIRLAKPPEEKRLVVTPSRESSRPRAVAPTSHAPLEPSPGSAEGLPWQSLSVKDDAMTVPNSGFSDNQLVLRGGGSATLEKPDAPTLDRATGARDPSAALAMYQRPAPAPEPAAQPSGAPGSMRLSEPAAVATNPAAGLPSFSVLDRFTVIQSGQKVQFIDQDGSTYSGTLHTQGGVDSASMTPPTTVFAPTRQSVQAVEAGREPPARRLSFSDVPFTVLGTNKSLNERVVFRGSLSSLSGPAREGQVWFRNTLPRDADSESSSESFQPSLGAGRITGQALVGDQEVAVEVDAASDER